MEFMQDYYPSSSTPREGAADSKRFAHSAEPNRLLVGLLGSWVAVFFSCFLAVLLSCCLAASLACLLKKLKNCAKLQPKSSPEGP